MGDIKNILRKLKTWFIRCHRGKWGNAELRGKPKFSIVAKRLGGAALWWHFCEASVQVIHQ